MAYEFVTGPSTTPDSPFMLHAWTYTTLANELYAKLQDETIHIDELDSIKEQVEKLKL